MQKFRRVSGGIFVFWICLATRNSKYVIKKVYGRAVHRKTHCSQSPNLKLISHENTLRIKAKAAHFCRKTKNACNRGYYLVLDLDFNKKTCYVASFKEPEYDLAVREYQTLERKLDQGKSVVLVSVSDIKGLDEAYPNYFLNLRFFNESIKFMLEMNKKRG